MSWFSIYSPWDSCFGGGSPEAKMETALRKADRDRAGNAGSGLCNSLEGRKMLQCVMWSLFISASLENTCRENSFTSEKTLYCNNPGSVHTLWSNTPLWL